MIRAPARLREQHGMLRFQSGIMDTLDGSHGQTFTFLPVVYEDDCQVAESRFEWCDDDDPSYEVQVTFL